MSTNAVYVGKTNRAILNGTDDLSLWSEEELIRGQRRDKNGRWAGRPPKVVPRQVHDELVRRRMSEAYDLLRDNVVAATKVLVQIATDKKADATVRLKAATTILDRVLGKAPERIDVHAHGLPPWMEAMEEAVVIVADADSIPAIDTTAGEEG